MGGGALFCPRMALTQGVVSCTYEQWFRPYSARSRYCQLPVLVGACNAFCSSGLAVMVWQLLLVVWLLLVMLPGPREYAHVATVVLLGMTCTLFESAALASFTGAVYMLACLLVVAPTPCGPSLPSVNIWECFTLTWTA